MTSAERARVGMLVPHVGMSGAEICIAQLLRGLPRDQFEIHLIAPSTQPLLKIAQDNGFVAHEHKFPTLPSTSIETSRFRIFNPFATAFALLLVLQSSLQLARLGRKHHLQVMFTTSMMAHIMSVLAHLWFPTMRAVINLQDIIAPRLARGAGRRFFGLIARLADRVIVPSQAVADSLTFSKNVALVFNGADLSAYKSVTTGTLREELKVAADTPLIVVIARLTPWKGQKTFLEAASGLVHAGIKSHFVIVGDDIDPATGGGHYRAELEAYAKTLGLDGKVTFTGYRKDLPNVIHSLDILVAPSLRPEPFGLIVCEAMACRKPVIGARTGGIAEIVVDNETGRLFEPGDAYMLQACMRQLVKDPGLCAQYGQAGQQRVEQYFTLDRYLSSMADIFRQAAR